MAADLAAFQCPFADAGCPFTSASDRELSKHVADDTQAHLVLLLRSYSALKSRCTFLEDQLRNLRMGASFHLATVLQSCPPEQLAPLSSLLSLLDQSSHLKRPGDTLLMPLPLDEMEPLKARSGVWYSPPFYVGDGYKMSVGTRPTNESEGYATVYVFLLPGEFDHQLPWPPRDLDRMDIEIVADVCGSDVELTKSIHIPFSTLDMTERVRAEMRKTLYTDEQFWSQSLAVLLTANTPVSDITAAYRLTLVHTQALSEL